MISGEVIRFGFPLQILLIELIRLHVVNLVGKMLFQLKLEHVAWQFISHKVRENTAWRITQIVEQEVPFDKTNRIIQCHDRIIVTAPESIVQKCLPRQIPSRLKPDGNVCLLYSSQKT